MISRKSCSLIHASLAMSALLCFSRIAVAETDAERAASLYQQGNAAVERSQWGEAEAAYREAWKLAHTFDVAANLGLVELRLGNHRAAAEFLAYSMRMAPPSSKPAQRQRTQQLFDEAKVKVGTVRVKLNVEGADVSVDGAPIAADDVQHEVFVDPGRHVIEAGSAGYQVGRMAFEVSAGKATEVALTLVPVPAERRSLVPAFVMGGVGAAALAGGIGLVVIGGMKGSSAQSQYNALIKAGQSCVTGASNHDASCNQLSTTASTGDTMHDVGVGLLIGAGAAAVGAVVYAVWPKARPGTQTGALSVAPAVSPTAAGLSFSGTF